MSGLAKQMMQLNSITGFSTPKHRDSVQAIVYTSLRAHVQVWHVDDWFKWMLLALILSALKLIDRIESVSVFGGGIGRWWGYPHA